MVKLMRDERGYSLIELITVMGIMVVVGGILAGTWITYYPTFAIEQAATKLASDLNYAAYQAVSTQNKWMVIFLYPPRPGATQVRLNDYPADPTEGTWIFRADAYIIANDDGWMGVHPRLYTIGDTLRFDWSKRGDDKMGRNELFSGPHRLGRTIDFSTDRGEEPTALEFYAPDRVIFKWDWTVESVRRGYTSKRNRASLWLVDNHYNPNIDSHDNDLHRRRVKIRPNARVEISLK